ncbi:MAG TPA: hypothetical protein DIC35_03080 [Candidatus Moranbacteria bacterium]|nr:hypothetical protein [Candidatus Moranbacteria bacterium]
MCEFETPLFIIYSYSSVIILSLIIAFSILLKNPKHSLNRSAFYFISILALWTMGDLVQWLTRNVQISEFFLRLSNLVDFFFLFFLYFAYALIGKDLNWKKKLIFALPIFITVFLVVGNYGMGNVEPLYCDYDSGWVIYYSLFIDLVYSVWASAILIKEYLRPLAFYKTKLQIKVLVFTIISFILLNIAYETVDIFRVMDKLNIEISPYYVLVNLFFLVLMIFNIIEYDLFEFSSVPRRWFAFSVLSVIFLGMFFLSLTPLFYFILLIFYIMIIWMFWGR